jgi:DNA polymerase III subunit gamma/tau
VIEKNAAEHRGIDAVREISSTMALMPLYLQNKVYILDEFHQMTKEAQSSLLKVLEEAPKNVFIILCTTHPGKILPTVKNRCQQFRFSSLPRAKIITLLEEVVTYETVDISKAALELIADSAQGSPRHALVLLQQVIQLGDAGPAEIKKLLTSEDDNPEVFQVCLKLSGPWAALMGAYDGVKEQGAPAIGMIVAGYYRNKLISAKNKADADKIARVLELFVVPFDDGKLGENQLILSLYKASNILRTNVS